MIHRLDSIVRRPLNVTVLTLFLLVTVVAARAFLNKLDGIIMGLDNDVYVNPWNDWWTEKALRDPNLTLWQTDHLFFPQGADLTYHSFSHLNTAGALLLKPFLGPLVAYNLVVLLNYVLAGLAMFQLGRYLTSSTVAGILAGIVFVFNPHNMYQSSHPVLISVWCFPWTTLFLIRSARENNIKLAAIAAFFVFLTAAASTLLLLLTTIRLAILFGYKILTCKWTLRSWRVISCFVFLSVILCLPLLLPLLRVAKQGNDSFVMNATDSIPMDITAPFVPHWFFWYKRGLYFGLVPILLVFYAIKTNKAARPWFALLLGTFLFAIGPRPRFFDTQLNVTLPWSSLIAPVLRNMYRVNILVAFTLATLVAFGWATYYKRLNFNLRIRTLIILAITLLVLADFLSAPIPFTPIKVSPFYTEYLKSVPDNIALATLPFGRQQDKHYLFYQTFHGHKITGGFIARPADDTFSFILDNPLLRAGAGELKPAPIPSRPLPHMRELAEANLGYLVIDKTLIDNVEAWRQAIPLSPVYEDDLVLAYETEP